MTLVGFTGANIRQIDAATSNVVRTLSLAWAAHTTQDRSDGSPGPAKRRPAAVSEHVEARTVRMPFVVFVTIPIWGLLFSAGALVQGPPRDLPPGAEPDPRWLGPIDPPEPDGGWRTQALASGEPLSFRQDPPLLLPRDDHGARLRTFTVAGDVPRVRFDRWNAETRDFEIETWERERTDTIAGTLVSVFEPSWSPDTIQQMLSRTRVGLDRPSLYLGSFRGAADAPRIAYALFLRTGSSAARPVEIGRIDDTAQYSSHVVNLAVPGFGDQRLATDYELAAVARRFYEHFEDSYEVLAVVPAAAHLDENGAYHRIVQNQVEGIGRSRVSNASEYGSAGTLLGVEAYHNARLLENRVSTHELTHTWSHAFDWTRIAGITRAGHQPSGHAPLMTGGESLVSAVLDPTRRAALRADGTAAIERVSAPARHHPLDLYAMGLLEPAQVPEWRVFFDQGQFSSTTTATPDPGTAIAGESKLVSINDVMAAHGPRSGPVLSSLSRATIVVSRDGLLSPEEMAYWNFFAARLEDPTGSGVVSFDGQPSFDVTTNRRIDLRTDIRPKALPRLGQPHDVDPEVFGATDCRGVEFTTPPRARVRVGERFRVAGRVTARDRTDFHQMLIRLWPSTGEESRAERAYGDVSRSGSFSVDLELRDGREGQYMVETFLFWPNADPQHARCVLSPVIVSPRAGN